MPYLDLNIFKNKRMPKLQKCLNQPDHQLIITILTIGFLIRLIIAIFLTPGYDEAYYYLYTENLDWSYFDHPILVALTTGFGRWITGEVSIFTLRLGAVLLHTGSLGLLYLTASHLFGKKTGIYTLAIASIIPIFQIAFGTITLPDCPLIFFWSASLYCASLEFFPKVSPEELSPENSFTYIPTYKIAILGILNGLACLGKYHGFLLAFGILLFCIITPRYRQVFYTKWAFIGILTFILTLFPIWIWNAQHDWITFKFHLSERFEPDPYDPLPTYKLPNLIGVFLGNIGYLFPTMGFPLWWVSLKNLYIQIPTFFNHQKREKRTKLDDQKWFILCISLPLTIGFTLLAYFQQILATWAMPGFWGLTILLGQQSVIWAEKYSRKKVKLWLKSTAIIVNILLFIALIHVTTGTFQKNSKYALFGGFISAQNDPSTELLDINQLRQEFQSSPQLQKYLENTDFIFTNTYYLGGLIDMALRPITDIPITCFSDDMRGYLFWSKSEEWVGKDALYITLKRFHNKPKFINDYRRYFTQIRELTTIPLRRGGVTTEEFYIYEAKNLIKPYDPQLAIYPLSTNEK
jgi:4-amino-4-deoxy-L-arabinose transferase-like glycosyltransferase